MATPRTVPQPAQPIGPDVRADDTPAQDVQPTDEDIRLEAYLLHVARGHAHGNDLEDWLEAERRLRAQTISRSDSGSPS